MQHRKNEKGKNCKILIAEEVQDNLKFLDEDRVFVTSDQSLVQGADVSLLIDCGELKRIPKRESVFNSGKTKVCIDHHGTTEAFCDYNYIDPDAAATGQIIFNLIKELIMDSENMDAAFSNESGVLRLSPEVKSKIADAIFTAITTDTGDFQYSNTQKESHEIVAELYDWGLNANKVSVEIYESNRIERLKLTAEIISIIEMLPITLYSEDKKQSGKVAIAYCSQDMLRKTGGKMEETEWVASDIRGIKGVEVAVFLKEEEENAIKASLRSKKFYDVAALAQKFDGGGHIRAAGYTSHSSLEDAINDIKRELITSNDNQ